MGESHDEAAGVQALQVLHEVTKDLHASLDLRATLDAVVQGGAAATEFAVACLNLLMPDGHLEIVAVAGPQEIHEALMGMREREENVREVLALAQQWGRLRFVEHTVNIDDLIDNAWVPDLARAASAEDWDPDDVLCAVLTTPGGQWLGLLSVDMPTTGRRPGQLTRQVLEIFADHAAIAITHARMHERVLASEAELEHAATHDALTGLGNRAMLTALSKTSTPATRSRSRW